MARNVSAKKGASRHQEKKISGRVQRKPRMLKSPMLKPRTLIIIPAYNEEKTIREVIRRSLPFGDVLVVDDASKDRTARIVRTFKNVGLIVHPKNTHIPQTVRDGMQYGLDHRYDYVITMDAGLSHLPEELPRFIDAPPCDLVLSYRAKRRNVPFHRRVLSKTAAVLINLALRPIGSGLPFPHFRDVTSGYRRYSRKAVQLLLRKKMKAKTFDFHTEALLLIYRNGLSIREVPITYVYSNSSLNSRVLKTGMKMFLDMVFSRRK
jgi:dolichol-phosphate mannosyltransferase